jgi:hypothetical protein
VGLRIGARGPSRYDADVRRVSATLVLVLVVACDGEDADSTCGIPTERIQVVASAIQNGSTLRAEVEFSTDGGPGKDMLALCDKDQLTIAGAPAEVVVRPERVVYSYTREETGTPSLRFDLQREDETSVGFTIDVPPAFEVTSPESAAEVSRSMDLLLEWAPPNPGESMRIELGEEIGNGVCLETDVAEHDYKGLSGVDIEDDGNWKIPADVIDSGARDRCEASYRFTRMLNSEYPSELADGGYLEGRVERIVAFVSVP